MMFKLACIGLDTSHSVKFTDLMQGSDKRVDGLKVVSCQRFPSAFQSEPNQNKRQQAMEEMNVRVTRSFDEAVDGVDGILIEINDPALHLEYFAKSVELGLPVFLDKPMADTVENARKIYQLAQDKKIKCWSASSLRFTPEIRNCCTKIPQPLIANTFGPLGKAPAGDSLVWYGVHAFEMLLTIMGTGARSVLAQNGEQGVAAIVNFADGRRGTVDCNSNCSSYGGRAQRGTDADSFIVNFANAGDIYQNLITALADFFLKGVVPVSLKTTFEIQALLNAAAQSVASGKEEPVAHL